MGTRELAYRPQDEGGSRHGIQGSQMINFHTLRDQGMPSGQLVYRREEYSFDTEVKPRGGRGISIVVNEVQLFVDDEDRVIYLSGYCPYQGWDKTELPPPAFSLATLVASDFGARGIQTGLAFGLNDLDSRWPVHVNPEGWVCVGDPADHGDQAVEFTPRCVAVLKKDFLRALWLRPLMLGGN